MNDFLKCQRCDYKQKRSRLVVKCVFLSVIFCILSFILGVAVGGSFGSKTANRCVVSASAAESTSTVSKWNPDWVQAPADWNQYGDLYNQVNLEEFSSLWEQRFASLYLDSYNITYQQTLNENYISIEGIAKDNFSDFTVYFPFSELYDYVVNDNMLFIYGLRVENVLGASFSEWGVCLSDFSFISTSGPDVPRYASALGSGNYYLGFAFDALDVGAPFSIRIRNIQLSCYLSSTEVSSVPRGYITPFSYVCDYYYNLGLDTVPGGGYTEEDLQAEYDRGYAEGDSAGYDRGYAEGDSAGYDRGYAEGDSAGYDRGYQAGLEVVEQDSYDAGYADGYSAASEELRDYLSSQYFYNMDFSYFAFFDADAEYYPGGNGTEYYFFVPDFTDSYYKFTSLQNSLRDELETRYPDEPVSSDNYDMQVWFKIDFPFGLARDALDFRFSLPNIPIADGETLSSQLLVMPVTVVLDSGKRISIGFVEDPNYKVSVEGQNWTSYALDLISVMPTDLIQSVEFAVRDYVSEISLSPLLSYLRLYSKSSNYIDSVSYTEGYNNGLALGKTFASQDSYNKGYNVGYGIGLSKAEKFDFTLAVSTVLGAPVSIVRDFLNFELLGVNLLSFITGVITLLVIVKCLKFFV